MGKFIYFNKHSWFAQCWPHTVELFQMSVSPSYRSIFRHGCSLFVMMLSAELFDFMQVSFYSKLELRKAHLALSMPLDFTTCVQRLKKRQPLTQSHLQCKLKFSEQGGLWQMVQSSSSFLILLIDCIDFGAWKLFVDLCSCGLIKTLHIVCHGRFSLLKSEMLAGQQWKA